MIYVHRRIQPPALDARHGQVLASADHLPYGTELSAGGKFDATEGCTLCDFTVLDDALYFFQYSLRHGH